MMRVNLEASSFSVVLTGSLGRGEATGGSDADWLLLVDGRSDPRHAMIARMSTGVSAVESFE
jgi:UTP:GlnB (protein PII) uridylyltransferase